MELSLGGAKEGSNWFEVDETPSVRTNCDEAKNAISFDDSVEFLLTIFDCEISAISVMVPDVTTDGGISVVIVVILCSNGDEEWLPLKTVCVNAAAVDWVLTKRVELKFPECEADVTIEVTTPFGCNVVAIDVDREIVDTEGLSEELRLKLLWDTGVSVTSAELTCDDDSPHSVVAGCEASRRVSLTLLPSAALFLRLLAGPVDDETGTDNDRTLSMVEGKPVA